MLFDQLSKTITSYDENASKYAEQWFEYTGVQPLLSKFLTNFSEGSRILDAGCGSGRDTLYIGSCGYDVVGVDLSSKLIAEARARAQNCFFRVMDIRELAYPDNLFQGIFCCAVLNHFVEEDVYAAFNEFERVLESEGLLMITLKRGEGLEFDNLNRFYKYYDLDKIVEIAAKYNFSVINKSHSQQNGHQVWEQVVFKLTKQKPETISQCFFCPGPLFFPQNRISKKAGVASILWSDDDVFFAVDCSPMTEGHVLMISQQHAYSFAQSKIEDHKIERAKNILRSCFTTMYGRRPIFLEHGSTSAQSKTKTCVDHAHIHALPLTHGLKRVLEGSLGSMDRHWTSKVSRAYYAQREYVYYEDKAKNGFIKESGQDEIQSQFFRIILGEFLGREKVKWAEILYDDDTNDVFKKTIDSCAAYFDRIVANKPVLSRQLETKNLLFLNGDISSRKQTIFDKAKQKYQNLSIKKKKSELLLEDLGEDQIIDDLIHELFKNNTDYQDYIGDDTAFLDMQLQDGERLVATVDSCPIPLIFKLGEKDYRYLGWLSMVISLSDIASSGANPRGALLSCEFPKSMKVAEFIDFLQGVSFAAEKYKCPIVGGNIKDTSHISVSSTIIGVANSSSNFKRVGAAPGDSLYVLGNMGYFWSAIIARQENLLLGKEDSELLEMTLRYPHPNLFAAQELNKTGCVTACMDASDGPTTCFFDLAKKNGLDILLHRNAFNDLSPVSEVARQTGLSKLTLMLTWGNWELVFFANKEQLDLKLQNHPLKDEIRWVGQATRGSGKVCFDRITKHDIIPDMSSKKFDPSNRDSIKNYLNLIKETKL